MNSNRISILMIFMSPILHAADADPTAIRKAVTLYASFDENVAADHAIGDRQMLTRYNRGKEDAHSMSRKASTQKSSRSRKVKGSAAAHCNPSMCCRETVESTFLRKGIPRSRKMAGPAASARGSTPIRISSSRRDFAIQFKSPRKAQTTATSGTISTTPSRARHPHGDVPAVPLGGKGTKEEDADVTMVRVKGATTSKKAIGTTSF